MIFGMNQTIDNSSLFLDLTKNDMIFQPKWQPCRGISILKVTVKSSKQKNPWVPTFWYTLSHRKFFIFHHPPHHLFRIFFLTDGQLSYFSRTGMFHIPDFYFREAIPAETG